MAHLLSGKNVLVTGGTGLVGSHLCEKLLELGARVVVLDIIVLPRSYFASRNLEGKVKLLMVDLVDWEKVQQAVKEYEIDYIFHLAAQALVGEAFNNPRRTFDSNLMGTVNVMEAARLNSRVKGVLVASSDKAYGKDCFNAKEDQKVFGDHPYDASKAGTDIISRTYFKTYGLPVAVARFGNIFGPGDLYFSRIVPAVMESVLTKKELQVRSNGQSRRDYLYVKDVAEGYVKMAECLDKVRGEAFNFTTNWNFSVIEIIEKIGEILGQKVKYKILDLKQNEIPNQSLNAEKAKQLLGWQPGFAFERGILETFEWYRDFFSKH